MTLETNIEKLKAGLRGALIRPGDEGYDAARKVYNGMIDKHPAFIAQCVDVADVIAAVNFGREAGLPLPFGAAATTAPDWGRG